MPDELSGDLDGIEAWGASMRDARFRDVDLTGARLDHVLLADVEVDGIVERLVVNGVDVTAFVHEHDPWQEARAALQATTPGELRAGWETLDAGWQALVARVLDLPPGTAERSVDGEWSLVETLRHLVFAIDKWVTVPVQGGAFHPLGLPNTGSRDFPFPGLDLDRSADLAEVLDVHEGRTTSFAGVLAGLRDDDLGRTVDVPENGPHPILECVRTVLEAAFWHLRYAARDLEVLEGSG